MKSLKRVLFLCIGNSCRSQMAEGFARRYGSDVMQVESAGMSPAAIIQPLTYEVMQEKGIDLEGQEPKDLGSMNVADFDLLVNMTGVKLPSRIPVAVREWKVEDPIGRTPEFYRQVRDQIETLVMRLILELRKQENRTNEPKPIRGFARLGRLRR